MGTEPQDYPNTEKAIEVIREAMDVIADCLLSTGVSPSRKKTPPLPRDSDRVWSVTSTTRRKRLRETIPPNEQPLPKGLPRGAQVFTHKPAAALSSVKTCSSSGVLTCLWRSAYHFRHKLTQRSLNHLGSSYRHAKTDPRPLYVPCSGISQGYKTTITTIVALQ